MMWGLGVGSGVQDDLPALPFEDGLDRRAQRPGQVGELADMISLDRSVAVPAPAHRRHLRDGRGRWVLDLIEALKLARREWMRRTAAPAVGWPAFDAPARAVIGVEREKGG